MFKKESRIALTLALTTCFYTLPARAALMNFTGTFAVQIETAILATPFRGTADVDTATGAFTFVDASDARVAGWEALSFHPGFDLLAAGMTFQPGLAAFGPGEGLSGGFGGAGPIAVEILGATNGAGNYIVNTGGTLGMPWTVGGKMAVSHYVDGDLALTTQVAFLGLPWTAEDFHFTINGRDYYLFGSDERTENQGGMLTLVTPIYLGTLAGGRTDSGLGGMGFLQLEFDGGLSSPSASFAPVPEPGTALLLGAGVLGLAIAGRRRRTA